MIDDYSTTSRSVKLTLWWTAGLSLLLIVATAGMSAAAGSEVAGDIETKEQAEPPAARITGRVQWGSDPVSGAGIELKANSGYYQTLPALARTQTGPDGRFNLPYSESGNYQIFAVAPSDEYWRWIGRSITVTAGERTYAGVFVLSKRLRLLEPANGLKLTTNRPTLRWQSFPGTFRYHVDLFDRRSGEAVLREYTTQTALRLPSPLAHGVEYAWAVQAYDSENVQIAYYGDWYFTVE